MPYRCVSISKTRLVCVVILYIYSQGIQVFRNFEAVLSNVGGGVVPFCTLVNCPSPLTDHLPRKREGIEREGGGGGERKRELVLPAAVMAGEYLRPNDIHGLQPLLHLLVDPGMVNYLLGCGFEMIIIRTLLLSKFYFCGCGSCILSVVLYISMI